MKTIFILLLTSFLSKFPQDIHVIDNFIIIEEDMSSYTYQAQLPHDIVSVSAIHWLLNNGKWKLMPYTTVEPDATITYGYYISSGIIYIVVSGQLNGISPPGPSVFNGNQIRITYP